MRPGLRRTAGALQSRCRASHVLTHERSKLAAPEAKPLLAVVGRAGVAASALVHGAPRRSCALRAGLTQLRAGILHGDGGGQVEEVTSCTCVRERFIPAEQLGRLTRLSRLQLAHRDQVLQRRG